jgi:hypothetical protein
MQVDTATTSSWKEKTQMDVSYIHIEALYGKRPVKQGSME